MITDLAIDENEVASQMAAADVPPLTTERVIEVAAVDTAFLAPEVAAKARGLLNPPH